MNVIFLSLILLITAHHQVNAQNSKSCKVYVRQLKESENLFVNCAMDNTVPVKMCMSCFKEHEEILVSYKTLIEAVHNDTHTHTIERCKDTYIDQDRLNIVQTIYNDVTGLWNKAFCNECFANYSTPSSSTQTILDKLNKVNSCLDTNENNEACIKCAGLYKDANTYYVDEVEKKQNKICFDLQDAMNHTRFLWSKQLHCCDREVQLTEFIAVSSIIACLPIIFYISMYFYTRRTEENHGMLLEDSERVPRVTESVNNVPSQINEITYPDKSTIKSNESTCDPGASTSESTCDPGASTSGSTNEVNKKKLIQF